MPINVTNPLVDGTGRATKAFASFLNMLGGSTSGSLEGRVTVLEGDVVSLSAAISAANVNISANTASIATLSAAAVSLSSQVNDAKIMAAWVTPWP